MTVTRFFTHRAMACDFAFQLFDSDAARARRAANVAFAEVDRLEQLLSRFVAHSDIARINAAGPGAAVQVDPETIECLQLAARWYTETGGAFDIAFRSRPKWVHAHAEEPAGSGHTVAQQAVTPLACDPDRHAIQVLLPGVDLDLGAIGKGYALDRAAAVLQEYGVTAGLLHSGQSSILAFGAPPDGRTWRIALRHPDQTVPPLGFIDTHAAALSGSGQLAHDQHIIDPRTNKPAEVQAAWSVAPTAADADALSTAFMLMSAVDVAALCGRCAGVSAILLDPAAQGLGLLSFGPHAVTPRTAPPGR